AAQSLDNSGGNDASPQDVRNMAAEKGVSNYDQTFTDSASVFFQTPYGRGRKWGSNINRFVDWGLGGWDFFFNNIALSASPLNLRWNSPGTAFQTVGGLAGFRGGEIFRPNVLGPVKADNPADITNTFFNVANVVLPTDPSHPFGNAGRNSVRGFPINQFDL